MTSMLPTTHDSTPTRTLPKDIKSYIATFDEEELRELAAADIEVRAGHDADAVRRLTAITDRIQPTDDRLRVRDTGVWLRPENWRNAVVLPRR